MKEQKYTLLDDYYFDVLRVVIEAFESSGYTPILVGGVAVQVYTIALVGVEGGGRFLRKTDDYDLVVLGGENIKIEDIIGALNGASFIANNAVFSIAVVRNGAKRPVLKVEYLNGGNESKEAQVYLNIFTEPNELEHISPEIAKIMYDEAVEIVIKNSRTLSELRVRVLRIEDLIATKLAKGREKDYKDVGNLVDIAKEKGIGLDWKRVENNLRSIKDSRTRNRAIDAMRSFEREPILVGR